LFLEKLIRLIAGFFRLLFKIFFSKILAKIYYETFRFRKGPFGQITAREIINGKTAYILITGLAIALLLANFLGRQPASAIETKLPHTVMANLVSSEFSNWDDNNELIEETATPYEILLAGKEKYDDALCTIEKTETATSADYGSTGFLAFSESGDMILKPQAISADSLSAGVAAAPRTEIVNYTVQNGDTVSTIARRFNVSINTVLWANNLSALSLIRPGDTLKILPVSGIVYKVRSGDTVSRIAKTYGIEEDKIIASNNLAGGLKAGQEIMLPGANRLVQSVASARSTSNYSGLSAISDAVKSPAPAAGSGKMNWPTQGHRITQYFSWRHNGVDIGNKVGTPIYAADDGVVEIASSGWNGGYGNTILLNHGGGKKTRYGHASKLLVSAGERVSQGQVIALMGSTGRSTGSHLHFEVIINGGRYNPLNYIK